MNAPISPDELIEQARNARGRDWPRAAEATAALRNQFPDMPIGYEIGAAAARSLRRFEEASAILTEAASRFPDRPWVISEQAWTTQALNDFDETRRLAAELRDRFPEVGAGYHVGAAAARSLLRFEEAKAILAEAASRFPDRAWVISEQAWTAQALDDFHEARRLGAELRDRFPDVGDGYHVGVAAARSLRRFDEAKAILAEAASRFPDRPWVISERAATDQAINDLVDASRFPDRPRVISEQAWTAQALNDFDEARRLGAELRDRFPDVGDGYHVGAAAARSLRRFDEAKAILAEAASRFPDRPWVISEQAWTAQALNDFDEARRLGAELRDRFPDVGDGYHVGAAAARSLQRFDEADAVVLAADARFPTESWPTALRATNACARGDLDQAIQLAAELRLRHPTAESGYDLGARMLQLQNRLAEAEEVLREAKPGFSSTPWYARRSAEIGHLRVNRAKAESLIEALGGGTPNLARPEKPDSGALDKVVVIVGMHRAGTSLCAKIINRLGVELGSPLLLPSVDNPDGFWEHREIMECHEALLEYLGACWDTIWSVRPAINEDLQNEAARSIIIRMKAVIVEQLQTSGGVWAFKDPRTACFLPLWTSLFKDLGVEPIWILAVRDPRAVAASLHARNRLPVEIAELLWSEHYLNALRHLGPCISCVVHYEKWFTSPRHQLNDLARAIGIDAMGAIDEAERSIISELRHNVPGSGNTILDIAQDVYAWLHPEPLNFRYLQRTARSAWLDLETLAANGRQCKSLAT